MYAQKFPLDAVHRIFDALDLIARSEYPGAEQLDKIRAELGTYIGRDVIVPAGTYVLVTPEAATDLGPVGVLGEPAYPGMARQDRELVEAASGVDETPNSAGEALPLLQDEEEDGPMSAETEAAVEEVRAALEGEEAEDPADVADPYDEPDEAIDPAEGDTE